MKPLPVLSSDEEAERFVADSDLSEYDLSGLLPTRFVARDQVRVLLTRPALDRAMAEARRAAVPLERYLGELLESALSTD